VLKAAKNIETEIFVVDNNSSDGSKEYFKDKFNSVFFVWNNENIGFAKANNIAIKKATGKYILILNPDTIVGEDCFEKCVFFLQSHNDAGALGIKMLDGSGNFLKESKRSFPSPLTSLFKLFGLAGLFPHSKIFSKYHLGHLDKNKNNEADVLAGAFMMIPKEIIDLVGNFDEDFFMYGEDIDLSYRIQKAGYKNYYFAESCIIHFKGESTRKGSLNYVKLFYKAMIFFEAENEPGK
jgi:GT2 family glycosyltransferase